MPGPMYPQPAASVFERISRPARHLAASAEGLLVMRGEHAPTVPLQFERVASEHPDRVFLRFGSQQLTYAEANRIINTHAHAYTVLGIGKGDVVALLLENRPAFLWHVLALGKIGAVASLINTHLRDEPLQHAIQVCEPRMVIVGTELWDAFTDVRRSLPADVASSARSDVDLEMPFPETLDIPAFADVLETVGNSDPPSTRLQRLSDLFTYIYTSGTTGLPKPARVKHRRFYQAGHVWSGAAFRLSPQDVLYNCLPLYHSNALLLATSSVITAGATLALARRFSARRFWDDIRAHRATRFIYIGELCRYLLNQPESPDDRSHLVDTISGNGLRPEIWKPFQERFGIRRIVEFYGATEGNVITLNLTGKPGSVGQMQPYLQRLAVWDEDAQDFVRDERGRLKNAQPGQPGIILGRINPAVPFEGYKDPEQTERKIVRNAFRKGDAWFNTGDLMQRDAFRNLYFMDRLGDTFRWKGENVSTVEVEKQIAHWNPVQEVAVYGVEVPGADGRAGMAAMVLDHHAAFDPAAFFEHVEAHLPAYARPLFVRLAEKLEKTSTFKVKKHELQREGFDPSRIDEPFYVIDPAERSYVPLTPERYEQICRGEARL